MWGAQDSRSGREGGRIRERNERGREGWERESGNAEEESGRRGNGFGAIQG